MIVILAWFSHLFAFSYFSLSLINSIGEDRYKETDRLIVDKHIHVCIYMLYNVQIHFILLTKLIEFVPNPWFYGLYNFKALSLISTKSQENFQWAPSLMSMGNPISPSFCEFSQLYQRPWYSRVNFHGELLITHHSHALLWDECL